MNGLYWLIERILEECYWNQRTIGCSNCPHYENCPRELLKDKD